LKPSPWLNLSQGCRGTNEEAVAMVQARREAILDKVIGHGGQIWGCTKIGLIAFADRWDVRKRN
jgi:hypothetical protein